MSGRGHGPRPDVDRLRDPPLAVDRTDALIHLDLKSLPGLLDWPAIFGDARPVELEAGCGKGRFIALAATTFSDRNFVGVERAGRFFRRAVERVGKRGLTNVRLLHADVAELLVDRLADRSLAGWRQYFPDPWPKKRHHKRRFFTPGVVAHLARVLESGALLRVTTDHAEYAQLIRALLAARDEFEDARRDAALWELPGMDEYTEFGVTNFEIKYRRLGRPIHRLAWRRK